MKKIIFLILIFTLSFSTGCKKYLDEEPKTGVSIDWLYSTSDGLETATVGLYSINREIYHFVPHENAATLYLQAMNDLVVARSGYISSIAKFDKTIFSPYNHGSSIISKIWRHHYKVIDRANAIIEAGAIIEGMDEEALNQVLAQARVFRAQSLFTLWRMFNNVYIPKASTNPDNVFEKVEQPSSREAIFALLNEDLDFGIAHLPWTDSFGKLTKAVSHHLKAKVALWEGEWQTAADNAEAIINSGHFQLMSSPADVFVGDRNTQEALWVIQFSEGQAGGGPRNFIPANFQTAYHKVEGAKAGQDQGGRGFGFLYPNDYLLGLYDQSDTRLSSYYRLKYFYNDEENLPDGVALGDEIVIPKTGSTQSLYYQRTHPSCQKFRDESLEGTAVFSYNNVIVYRLAETHLIAAEAYMRMSNPTKSYELISPLQDRADVEPLSDLTELELIQEQAKELAFEGQRWFFLKRLNKLVFQVQHFSGDDSYHNDARGNIREFMNNFPIPQAELDLLGDDYPQNEGY